ncbi:MULTISPECIES: helix-turn-helix domain-containing protein [Burkholderia]|uniref:helix-turn-helix domain-containing protein n=1 Tax=Burkholderia TaxID=32008 RepID=UPI000B19E66F|nr:MULTISPECIES: helix-turn-helix domain-containing protein [Burkholderia]MDV2108640.1 helix-turn-helix domain-containing protein [Burkholderia pseudomallei]MDV2177222.1 helix-turn-helix domain-containing protein [Burkholderia pseudomallei]VWB45464.1 putative DNA-binding protein [Burkholderia stagnalis]
MTSAINTVGLQSHRPGDFSPRPSAYTGREYLTTEEAAELLGLRPQTLRKAYSSDGCYFSVVPKKAVNRRLYWKADAVRALIEGV